MTAFENQIGTLCDIRSSVDWSSRILQKTKNSMKGKRFVILVGPEFPKAVFEVEEKKFNDNPKRYAQYRIVGNGVWK